MTFIKNIKKFGKKVLPGPISYFISKYLLRKPNKYTFSDISKDFTTPIRYKIYSNILGKIDVDDKSKQGFLNLTLNRYSDDFWFWMLYKDIQLKSNLKKLIPRMPEDKIQLQFTGHSGKDTLKEAFTFYQFIKNISKKNNIDFNQNIKILDFGCGWGRIIRFFLKDLPASNLYGIDCDSEIIEVCKNSNLNCNFSVNGIFPPTEFKDNSFDIIYAYSVFSHLSEEAHKKWIIEFKRILKPNGVLIATTRPRDFILICADTRKMVESEVQFFAKGLVNTFSDTEKILEKYDNGEYIYEPIGGGGIRDGSFYGETCIPSRYVKKVWTQCFKKVDFINFKKHYRFNQNAIIAIK